jgi:DNA-binding MarR family transcriptional regulator
MSFKFTDAVFRITNNGIYCPFCERVFTGGTTIKRKIQAEMRERVLTAEGELLEHTKTHPFGHAEKAVLLALANHANEDGICWPGYTLLCAETYLSRGSVSAAIANLSKMNLITIMEQSKRRSTTYKLNLETDPDVIDAKQRKAMKDAGIEIPTETVRLRGKTYTRKPADDTQPPTTAFDIEDEDDFLPVPQ